MQLSPLCSGSSGNATYVEMGGLRLLVDAGATGRRIEALERLLALYRSDEMQQR